MNELKAAYHALQKEITAADKHIEKIEAVKQKHQKRLESHREELAHAQQKLSTTIEALARETATEKDLDRTRGAVDSLEKKENDLMAVIGVLDGDIAKILEQKTVKEADAKRVKEKIAQKISEDLMQKIKEPFFDAYAAHRTFYQSQGMYGIGIKDFLAVLSQRLLTHPFIDDEAVKAKGAELLTRVIG